MAQAVNGSPVAVSSPNDISPVETHSPPGSYLWPGARHTGSRRPTDTAGRACTRPRSTDTARRARHPVGYQGRSSFPEVVELPRIGTGIFAKYPAAVDSNPKLRSRSASIINIDQHTCIIVVATCLVQAYDLIGPTTDLQSSSASSSTTRQEHASSTKATWSRSPPPQRHASASSSRPASSRPTPSSASRLARNGRTSTSTSCAPMELPTPTAAPVAGAWPEADLEPISADVVSERPERSMSCTTRSG